MQHMHVRTYSRVRICTYFIIHAHPAGLPGPVQPPEYLSALRDHLQNLAHLPLLVYCFKVSMSTTILGVMYMYVYCIHLSITMYVCVLYTLEYYYVCMCTVYT